MQKRGTVVRFTVAGCGSRLAVRSKVTAKEDATLRSQRTVRATYAVRLARLADERRRGFARVRLQGSKSRSPRFEVVVVPDVAWRDLLLRHRRDS